MKAKNETDTDKNSTIKDKLIIYGIDIAKQIIIAVVKAKLTPKKPEKVVTVSEVPNKKTVNKIRKKNLLGRIIFAALFKEFVLDRLQAKVALKPDSQDFSWLLEYPLRKQLIDLNDYIEILNRDSKVLDLGSGSGYFAVETARFLNQSGKVYCVDINFSALEKLAVKAEAEQISNIEFHRANINNLPFETDTYDVAFMNMTFGQLKDKVKALNEASRVLKKGGYLIITELLIDPYYCLKSTVMSDANSTNLKVVSEKGNFLKYTVILKK